MRRVYLDNTATTPLHPEVVEVMLPYLRDIYGNPQSIHNWGDAPREAIEDARAGLCRDQRSGRRLRVGQAGRTGKEHPGGHHRRLHHACQWEVGTIPNIEEIATLLKGRGIVFHTDEDSS
ncbi:aminotransferase class V-fold PLP-dependent enzyme [Dehalococcoidia bacterium]|nr:aminotransferase class V-fold PLP-dependent enzyme [Dehalococcoidia bacterium]